MTYDTQATNPNPPAGDIQPVPVRITHVEAGVQLGQAPPVQHRRRYRTHYETFVLTANNPAQPILPPDDDRVIGWVQALDNDIVIGPTAGVAGANLNTAQTPATPTQPNGTLIPASNGAPYPVQDNGPVWAGITNATGNSRVSVTAIYRD